jgi:sulfur-carrier protein
MSLVRIPTALRPEVGGRREVEVAGETVGEVLATLVETFPGLADRILRDGEVQPFVNVYADGDDIGVLAGLATPTRPDSTILLLPAMAGGSRPFVLEGDVEPHPVLGHLAVVDGDVEARRLGNA